MLAPEPADLRALARLEEDARPAATASRPEPVSPSPTARLEQSATVPAPPAQASQVPVSLAEQPTVWAASLSAPAAMPPTFVASGEVAATASA